MSKKLYIYNRENIPRGKFMSGAISQFNYGFPSYGWNTSWRNASASLRSNETFAEYEKRNNEARAKALKEYEAELVKLEQEHKNAPLTQIEKSSLQNSILETIRKEEHSGGLGSALAGTAVFGGAMTAPHWKTDDTVLKMFYSGDKKTLDLFKTHPDLMEEAQKNMRKLDNTYKKDLKRAKTQKEIKRIKQEHAKFRKRMEAALKSGKPEEVAKLTAEAGVGKGVKNNRFARTKRTSKGKSSIRSREAAIRNANMSGKLKVKEPKSGTSFLRNLGGKSAFMNAGVFMLLPMIMDAGKIKSAYDIDKETGNKQLMQSGTKAGLSAVAFMGGDAIGKTVVKKSMGKIAGKIAAKVATKGAGKLLGTAIGSIVPGAGTLVGLALGTLADFAIEKWVLPKIFENDAVTEKQVKSMDDNTLVQTIQEQYMQGKDIDKKQLAVLERKLDTETMNELKRVHNMKDDERTKYIESMQAAQAAQMAQAAQAQGQTQAA